MHTVGAAPRGFVGRAEELAAVRAAIDAGGCVVAGAAGVGKSRLATEAAAGRPALRVLATHSAAVVPFGAFAHLLPPDAQRGTTVIPAFIHMLRAKYARTPPVVFVDDAHLLDDASAALVLSLVTAGVARPLVTIRTPEPVPDAIAALWKEQGLERIDLQTLGRLDAADLVRSELEGRATSRSVTRIADLSMGNPLYIAELLRDARQSGALVDVDGQWHWREELLAFDRLSVLIQRRTEAVSPAARHALEIVAVVERLPLTVLSKATNEVAVEELERQGLITIAADAGAEVSVAHPLYGEVVSAGLPRTTGIRIRREAAAALRAGGADVLRVAALLLDTGASDPALYLEASTLARRRGGVRFALRLAESAGDDLDAALVVAAALVDLGRFDDVEPVLAPHEAEAARAPLEVSVEYLWSRSRALLRGSGPDDVRDALLERARSWHTGTEWVALLAAERGWAALYDGRPVDALREIEDFVQNPDVSPHRRFFMCMLAMNAHYRLASFDDVLAVRASMQDLATAMGAPPAEVRVGMMTGTIFPAIHRAHDVAGIEAYLLSARAEAMADGDRTRLSGAAGLLGELALRRGHGSEALTYLAEAFDALGEADALNESLNAATMNASAHALCGDADRAAAMVKDIDRMAATQPRNARKHVLQIETARALANGAAGRTSVAAADLLALADAGYNDPAGELNALYEALRHGADARIVADRLRARLPGTQHDLAELWRDHADAVAADDAPAQLAVARRLHERGCDLHAAEAAARAAHAYAASGRTSLSREAAALVSAYVAPCGTVSSWALQFRPDAPPLTTREREIAVLAARGRTNKQIADELFLSTRTVESHLLNACQKLGVANRRLLAGVIGQ